MIRRSFFSILLAPFLPKQKSKIVLRRGDIVGVKLVGPVGPTGDQGPVGPVGCPGPYTVVNISGATFFLYCDYGRKDAGGYAHL